MADEFSSAITPVFSSTWIN